MIPLLLSLAMHNASQGKSAFSLDDDGAVRIEIQVGAIDLPELCNVDFAVRDRTQQEANLETCAQNAYPYWVGIRADAQKCKVQYVAWHEVEPKTVPPVVALDARADCGRVPAVLGIDWGLFGSSYLDHTSVAKIEVPGREPQVFAFSKRARKLDVQVRRPLPFVIVAAGGALAVVAMIAGVLFGRSRMRPRRPAPPAPTPTEPRA